METVLTEPLTALDSRRIDKLVDDQGYGGLVELVQTADFLGMNERFTSHLFEHLRASIDASTCLELFGLCG